MCARPPGRRVRHASSRFRARGRDSPVAQDAHFVGAVALDLHRTLPLNVHNAVPRRPASSTAALSNDGVENVAALTLIEHHGLNAIGSTGHIPVFRTCRRYRPNWRYLLEGARHPVEQERQIHIFGNLLRMRGTQGDLYFESHISDKADEDVMSVLAAAISDGDWVLDIGANIGFVSLVMSMLSPKGNVFAFEPAHVTRGILEKNVKLNERHNISISDAALSDSDGSSTLNYRQSNCSGSFVSESAAFEDLDNLMKDRIRLSRLDDEYESLGVTSCSLMKIDIEGHEPNFLRGASVFIKKFEPLAVMEANHFCLNVINRTSLPEFIELTFENFPYVFAFQESNYFELHDADSRWRFFHENSVHNAYQNVFCGFDRVHMIRQLNVAFGAIEETRRLTVEARQLRSEKTVLEAQVQCLAEEISALRTSRPLVAAAKINKLLGR